jgi:gliotoxin/aspirochlorine biosynthesis aminotransferase
LSVFASPDLADPSPFVSALSLHPTSLGCDPERVHVVWSMSKDLAASGVRLVCPFLAWISALLTFAQRPA